MSLETLHQILAKYKDIPYDRIVSDLGKVKPSPIADDDMIELLKKLQEDCKELSDIEHKTYNESIEHQNRYREQKDLRKMIYEDGNQLHHTYTKLQHQETTFYKNTPIFQLKQSYPTHPICLNDLPKSIIQEMILNKYGHCSFYKYNKKECIEILEGKRQIF